MGIQGLMSHLEPYLTQKTWHREGKSDVLGRFQSERSLLIDGPSFAHWIYHELVKTRSNRCQCLEMLPSYQELAEAAVSWLEQMEDFGFAVYEESGCIESLIPMLNPSFIVQQACLL